MTNPIYAIGDLHGRVDEFERALSLIERDGGTDASYNAHKGLGYMARIVETYAEDDDPEYETAHRPPDLITHVAVHKMTVHDGQFARFQHTPTRDKNRKRRLYESSDTFREIYRWRAGIEATMSRLKYQMHLAHLRVRGMPAMRYTVNLRAPGLNIRGCAAVQE